MISKLSFFVGEDFILGTGTRARLRKKKKNVKF